MSTVRKLGEAFQTYNSEAEYFIDRYEALYFNEVHKELIKFLPLTPALVLDVGSGSGRDSAALASRGYFVVSAEPAVRLHQWAKEHHKNQNIFWVEDSLPRLEKVKQLDHKYDLIIASAVLMHLSLSEVDESVMELSHLLKSDGVLYISIRHGEADLGRYFYEISDAEINDIAMKHDLREVYTSSSNDVFYREGIRWSVLIYKRK